MIHLCDRESDYYALLKLYVHDDVQFITLRIIANCDKVKNFEKCSLLNSSTIYFFKSFPYVYNTFYLPYFSLMYLCHLIIARTRTPEIHIFLSLSESVWTFNIYIMQQLCGAVMKTTLLHIKGPTVWNGKMIKCWWWIKEKC